MSIRQIDNIESKIWNVDNKDFVNNKPDFLTSSIPLLLAVSDENPFRVVETIHGFYILKGKLSMQPTAIFVSLSTVVISVLPSSFDNITITFKIAPQYFKDRDSVSGSTDKKVGISITNDTKEIVLHGLAQTINEDDDLYINMPFFVDKTS